MVIRLSLRTSSTKVRRRGICWRDYKIDILSGGEGFIEEWRDFLRRKLGDEAIIRSAFGSTDKGLGEGIETELTVVLRNLLRICQLFLKDPHRAVEVAEDVFPHGQVLPRSDASAREFVVHLLKVDPSRDARLPMVFQYDPTTYFNEEVVTKREHGRELHELVTTVLKDGLASPRIRYNIQDESGTISFRQALEQIEKTFGLETLRQAARLERPFMRLPFFYVYNRSDGTVSIDGANIYPEEVGTMIENSREIADMISSFILTITPEHRLQIDLETLKDYEPDGDDATSRVRELFCCELPKFSHGYKALVDEGLATSDLSICLHDYGHGPFIDSPLVNKGVIKYQYIAKRVTGK